MYIKKIEIDGYKNLEKVNVEPNKSINILCGDNGQGKTNFLEAINLFCGKKEFHNFKDIEMIGFSKELALMNIKFFDEERDMESEIVIADKKKFSINKVKLLKLNDFSKYLESVTFSPEDMDIVDGASQMRRNFLDNAILPLKYDYFKYLKNYNKVLKQKNALLKDNKKFKDFDIWDIQLAKLGTIITICRNDYIKRIKPICEEIYKEISKNKESLSIEYNSTIYKEDLDTTYSEDKVKIYYEKLKEKREEDKERKFTSVGIQRDDIEIKINNMEAKDYGSRGQRRSCVVALKLGEAALLKKIKNKNPIILLDDIVSELDIKRQKYILNNIKNNQVFITCCDINNTLSLQDGKVFYIKEGKVLKEEEKIKKRR